MKAKKLTIKQKKFADNYIKSGNATQSYINAGYSVRSENAAGVEGHKLLRNPKVKNYIDEKMQEISDKQIAKAEEVLKYLTSSMRGEIEEEVIVVENIGDYESKAKKIKKQLSAKDRIKAAELLGKRYSLFTDKVDFEGDLGLNLVIDYGENEES